MSDYIGNVAEDLDRQVLFNMPLRKAIILFSALLFAAVAICSSVAYYFAMRKILNESLAQELRQAMDTRRLTLKAELDREVLLLKVLSEYPAVRDYFLNPEDKKRKEESFALFEHHKEYFQSKIINWINVTDSNYYVNGKLMEKYSASNPNHSWFFEALENKNPPAIKVAYDYLNRHIFDLYIDYPVYSEGKTIGVISGRISLLKFINRLDLPENIFIFDKDGIIISAADKKIVQEQKTLRDLFDAQGEKVYEGTHGMNKNSSRVFDFGEVQYVVNSMEKLDLFLVAKDKVDIGKIIEERASIVFFALLLLILLIFVVFNKFMGHVLKPISKNMLSYIETSLLDELTKLPNKRFFNIRIEDEWNRAIRGKYHLSFLMMDLDRFKNYNDKHGHLEGDRLLREVARVFSYCVNRTSDFSARFGGEEFCVILPNTKIEGAKKIAENIRIFMERAGNATISIGLVCKIPALEDSMQEFVEQADQKLYEAKNTGRNKVCW
jgi:diguanylate cyclase (GGDEF)-like protein